MVNVVEFPSENIKIALESSSIRAGRPIFIPWDFVFYGNVATTGLDYAWFVCMRSGHPPLRGVIIIETVA